MEFKRTTRGSGGQPDLAPMIDVVFHLLIFFMAFSVLYQTTMSIDVELPKAVSGSDVRSDRFEISVTKDGLFLSTGRSSPRQRWSKPLEKRWLSILICLC